jgi:hypothetical protein
MTERERLRWQLGLIIFRAMTRALSIPGIGQQEVARAFAMAAATLAEPPETDAPPLIPPQEPRWLS